MSSSVPLKRKRRIIRTFYKKSLYPPLKKIEQTVQRAVLSALKKAVPSFDSFRRYGIPAGLCSKLELPRVLLERKQLLLRELPAFTGQQSLHPLFLREQEVSLPELDVTTVEGGLAMARAAHLTQDGLLIPELSEEFTALDPLKHSLFTYKKSRLPIEVKEFKGRVASLVASGHNNYYHWLFDVASRFYLLERFDREIDFFYLSQECQFQRDCIKLLGIPREKIIASNEHPYVQAEELIILSFLLHPFVEKQGNFPLPSWIVSYLKERFCSKQLRKKARRIFISRAGGNRRCILNEEELLPILKRRGFEIFALEKLSFAEQVALFRDAEYVVAPHGAGLANLVFAPSSCRVLEIFAPRSTCICFWSLSRLNRLSYDHMYGEAGHPETECVEEKGFDHIVVDVSLFEKRVEALFS